MKQIGPSLTLAFLLTLGAAEERPAIRQALAALDHGDFATAERTLRPDVEAHPNDASGLTLLGVALDRLNKVAEADELHRRAVAAAPRSVDVLTNYANHLLAAGKEEEARKTYLRVVAFDPSQFTASVQLARLAVMRKDGAEALAYLKHLKAAQQATPLVAVLRVAALDASGDRAGAEELAAELTAAAGNGLDLNFSIGLAMANAGQYERAETFFTKALAAAPSDFNVLVNLGVVASHNGHSQRAREVLESALRQQPQNPDVLYNLALVDSAMGQTEAALRLVAQAARLAPNRADIQKLLAITTGDLGALEDAAAAWTGYVKLAPDDDAGRRERGYTAIQMGKFEQGLPDLEWFVSRHPADATGQFELGEAQAKDDPAKGLAHLDRAIELKPDFAAAYAFRGSLYYQSGKFEPAAKDLESAAALRPDDAAILDRLGQAYSALERTADAVRVLRRAAELAPKDSKTILHFARALADAGQAAESKAAMDRFRQLGPAVNKPVRGGLIDYLGLTPEQRRADYRARVEKAAHDHPTDAEAQVTLLRLLLEDGDFARAAETGQRIEAMKSAAASAAEVELDVAIAAFHNAGAAEGLQRMERVAESGRGGDYYLARAQMLDASGKAEDATAALEKALDQAPKRVDLYQQATAYLVAKGRFPEALSLLERAIRAVPGSRDILLAQAATLEIAGWTADAEKAFAGIESRWPEWHAVWVAHGLALQAHGHSQDAQRALSTAAALGAHTPAEKPLPSLKTLLERPSRDW